MNIIIRQAIKEDILSILEIINFEIEHSTSVYDYKKESLENKIEWFEKKKKDKLPVLVAEQDNNILGYGTFGIFRPWDGYQFSIEHSIYIDKDSRAKGIGKEIMKELIQIAIKLKYHTMIAGIDANNAKSIQFHLNFGFLEVGRFNQIGFKFDKWLDLIFMQLFLKEN